MAKRKHHFNKIIPYCVLIAILSIATFVIVQLFFSDTIRTRRNISAAEELTIKIPDIREYVQESSSLIDNVKGILDSIPEFHALQVVSKSTVIIWWEDKRQELASIDQISKKEKDIVLTLFEGGLEFSEYSYNRFSEKHSSNDSVYIILEYIPDEMERSFLQDTFYFLEKVTDNWYLYVYIDRMHPNQWLPLVTQENRGKIGSWFVKQE